MDAVQVTQLLRSMHSNKALCYTKIDAWDKGITAVNKVCTSLETYPWRAYTFCKLFFMFLLPSHPMQCMLARNVLPLHIFVT
jgi:hypothetical protein